MTDTPRGPTTEQLRARALGSCGAVTPSEAGGASFVAADLHTLPRPCLACNREPGERMCDLCQRLEEAEASAP